MQNNNTSMYKKETKHSRYTDKAFSVRQHLKPSSSTALPCGIQYRFINIENFHRSLLSVQINALQQHFTIFVTCLAFKYLHKLQCNYSARTTLSMSRCFVQGIIWKRTYFWMQISDFYR